MKYELVCGLEVHIELATDSKIFCSCSTKFGAKPNTHCCPICIGMPGTLPVLNKKVVEYAIMAGKATNCQINTISKFDRKNYFYPDLPKAYQLSQQDMPICKDGFVVLSSGKKIGITKIHIEEDAGKIIRREGKILVDYNRSGIPLIEIVSEPDISSVDEAREFVEKLQSLIKDMGISDCKMHEGSMRFDVNVSVKPKESDKLGVRAEIKNMNSIKFMSKAIEFEYNRQVEILERGEKVKRETRRYIEKSATTEKMREKEEEQDYKFFKEPDLVKIVVIKEMLEM